MKKPLQNVASPVCFSWLTLHMGGSMCTNMVCVRAVVTWYLLGEKGALWSASRFHGETRGTRRRRRPWHSSLLMLTGYVHYPKKYIWKILSIVHDRSKEFYWKFNRPVGAKMIQLQNPLLRFHKTTKGNFSGEDFQISPMVSFLDDSDSLAQIMPYITDPS